MFYSDIVSDNDNDDGMLERFPLKGSRGSGRDERIIKFIGLLLDNYYLETAYRTSPCLKPVIQSRKRHKMRLPEIYCL